MSKFVKIDEDNYINLEFVAQIRRDLGKDYTVVSLASPVVNISTTLTPDQLLGEAITSRRIRS
jgi:hypothetical protein